MTYDEIERRLRLPAPDEPTVLPALVLPIRVGMAPLSERTIDLRLGRRSRPMAMGLLGMVLLLVGALVGALLVGALRLEQLRNAVPIPGLYMGRGITLDYPSDWTRLTPHDAFGNSGSSVALIIGNRDVAGCEPDSPAVALNSPPPQPAPSGDGIVNVEAADQQGVIYHLEDRIYACLIEQPLEPGEVRLVVSHDRPQAIGVGPFGDFAGSWLAPNPEFGFPVVSAETGFTDSIGAMPARLIVRDRSTVPGAEQLRTWLVAIPYGPATLWWIQAVLRGPDRAALEAQVDAVARSLAYDDPPVPLDEANRDVALAAAIDSVDRDMRDYPGRRFVGCLPRTHGSIATTISDGPRGRLVEPLDVTCTTSVKANDLRAWEALLEIEWAADSDRGAGRWARQIMFDGSGVVLMEIDIAPGTGENLAFPGDPSSAPVSSVIPMFRPGDLARSVGLGAGMAFFDVDTATLPPEPHLYLEPGALVIIVSGPETYDGRDFYLGDNGFEIGWVGAEAKGRAVLMPARPTCPTIIDATELAYLSSLERRLCAPDELTLGPVQAARIALDPSWDEVESDPAWLAAEPTWWLFGGGGVDGLDRGLPIALAPGLTRLPTDGWLMVTGHFDDPASATCMVTNPASWGIAPVPQAAQTRRCLERFVVTSATPTEVPR